MILAGVRTSVAVFGLRPSHSGAAVHVAFGSEGRDAPVLSVYDGLLAGTPD